MKRIFIDVREPSEFKRGHVAGAVNIPPSHLLGDIAELADVPKDSELILYCRTGNRSNVAMYVLIAKGYSSVVNGINQSHVEARFMK